MQFEETIEEVFEDIWMRECRIQKKGRAPAFLVRKYQRARRDLREAQQALRNSQQTMVWNMLAALAAVISAAVAVAAFVAKVGLILIMLIACDTYVVLKAVRLALSRKMHRMKNLARPATLSWPHPDPVCPGLAAST